MVARQALIQTIETTRTIQVHPDYYEGDLSAMKKLLFMLMLVSFASAAQAQIESAVEIMRSDVRTQKIQILTQAMEFTSEEAATFWPLYRDYDNAMSDVWDKRVANIKEYAANFETMTDPVARKIIEQAFANDEAQLAVEREYFEKIAEEPAEPDDRDADRGTTSAGTR
jgi:hypothetical protein